MSSKDEYNDEIEKREKLIQVFLIISGFLLIFSSINVSTHLSGHVNCDSSGNISAEILGNVEEGSQNYLILFWDYFVFTIMYFILISRTETFPSLAYTVDLLATISSCFYSFLLILALVSADSLGILNFMFPIKYFYFTISLIFGSSLLSVETYKGLHALIDNKFKNKKDIVIKNVIPTFLNFLIVFGFAELVGGNTSADTFIIYLAIFYISYTAFIIIFDKKIEEFVIY